MEKEKKVVLVYWFWCIVHVNGIIRLVRFIEEPHGHPQIFHMSHRPAARRLIGRFTATVPTTLFRVQNGLRVKLRLEHVAVAAGLHSFDISETVWMGW